MDPSDNVCIEVLKPKTVPTGLIALGTVLQVNEDQLKLQITGGVLCLVERSNINKVYTCLKNPPKLGQIFKKGQQYVCKVLDRRQRRGHPDALDIIATLDPSAIVEDTLPNTMLIIPHVPLQCVIKSIEDHVYLMDLGFKGLLGFLAFDDAQAYIENYNDGKKFLVGQVVRCCLKKPLLSNNESRSVQLTLVEESMKNSKFSKKKVLGNVITKSCILPGSESFLTVMKVMKDGLIVNFMNEFGGFVDIYHLADEWHSPRGNYKIADQYNCTVLYYNNITKIFALSIRPISTYRKVLKHFLDNYRLGQFIEQASVAHLIGTKSINFKVDGQYKAVAHIRDALDQDVSTLTRDEISSALETAYPEGSEHKGRIKSINFADLILVLNLKRQQKSEEARLREDRLRAIEKSLLDPNRPLQSIPDFERLVLKTPNSADAWTKYSRFFLDNIETEKARIVCRRALKTINFRMEKEKLKVWLHLIKIEAKYGGVEKLRSTIDEASQTNDRLKLFQGCIRVLTNCGELDEAERLHEIILKTNNECADIWVDYIFFIMEHRKDLNKARNVFDKARKTLLKKDLLYLESRFAQAEFKFGDVERGKTIFEGLLNNNPKRTDLWKVYEAMIKKYGARQLDTAELREQNVQTLKRISESIELVSKKIGNQKKKLKLNKG